MFKCQLDQLQYLFSALMIAAEVGSFDSVQILVQNDAQLDICDINNNNAAELALLNGHGGIAEFLREKQNTGTMQNKPTTGGQGGQGQTFLKKPQVNMMDQFASEGSESYSERDEYSFSDTPVKVPKPRAAPPSIQSSPPTGGGGSNVDTGSWGSNSDTEADIVPQTVKTDGKKLNFNSLMANFSSDEEGEQSEPRLVLQSGTTTKPVPETESDWTDSEAQSAPIKVSNNAGSKLPLPPPPVAPESDAESESKWDDTSIEQSDRQHSKSKDNMINFYNKTTESTKPALPRVTISDDETSDDDGDAVNTTSNWDSHDEASLPADLPVMAPAGVNEKPTMSTSKSEDGKSSVQESESKWDTDDDSSSMHGSIGNVEKAENVFNINGTKEKLNDQSDWSDSEANSRPPSKMIQEKGKPKIYIAFQFDSECKYLE